MLVLWNMHRYAQFLSRKAYFRVISGLTLLLFFGLWRAESGAHREETRPRMAVFPPAILADGAASLTPMSIAVADLAVRRLAGILEPEYKVVPVDWLFEPATRDSMHFSDYAGRLARKLGFAVFAVPALQVTGNSVTGRVAVYRRENDAPAHELDFTLPGQRAEAAAERIAAAVLQALDAMLPEQMPGVSSARSAYYAAYFHYLMGRRQRALEMTTRHLEADPSHRAMWLLKGKIAFADSMLPEASLATRTMRLQSLTERLADLSDADTSDVTAARLAAEGYIWLEKFNEGAKYALRAYRHQHGDSKVYNLLAHLHFTRYRPLGFLNEVEIYEHALKCNPGDIQAYLELARVHLELNKTVQAQRVLERALAINSSHLRVLNALGQIYVTRGLTAKIFKTYEKILQLQPENPVAFYNLGVYYFNAGQDTMASKFFKRAIQLGNHRDSRLYLAKIAEKQGDLDAAIGYLRERIRLQREGEDPYAEEAKVHLFQIMLGLGKIDSTGKLIDSARESDPSKGTKR